MQRTKEGMGVDLNASSALQEAQNLYINKLEELVTVQAVAAAYGAYETSQKPTTELANALTQAVKDAERDKMVLPKMIENCTSKILGCSVGFGTGGGCHSLHVPKAPGRKVTNRRYTVKRSIPSVCHFPRRRRRIASTLATAYILYS